MGHLFLPRRRKFLQRGVPWAKWDESSELGLATDNTFVCLMENPSAGGNEAGQGGGLTGADLILTQSGSVAGASGGKRVFDGVNDRLNWTIAAVDALIANANKTWSVIMKLTDITKDVGNTYFFAFLDAAQANERIALSIQTDDKLTLNVEQDTVEDFNRKTTDSIATSTEYYVAAWADAGVNKIRAGFTATRPTKWSDFATNKRMESTLDGDFTGETFNDADLPNFMSLSNQDPQCVDASLYYIVVSNLTLINNAA